jgi:predicted membrane protein
MTTHAAERSPLVRARVAGALYLVANIFAPFTLLYLPSRFIVRGDAAATANNIIASASLFRFGIVGNLFTFIANIFLALALYQLLKIVLTPQPKRHTNLTRRIPNET